MGEKLEEELKEKPIAYLYNGSIQIDFICENGTKKTRTLKDYIGLGEEDTNQVKKYEKYGYKLLGVMGNKGEIPEYVTDFIAQNQQLLQDYQDRSELLSKGLNSGINISGKQGMIITTTSGESILFIKLNFSPEITSEMKTFRDLLKNILAGMGHGK